MRHDSGLHEGPVRGINWKWRGARNGLSLSSVVDGRPPQATQRVQATRYEPERVKEITAFASPGALPAFRAATARSTRRPIGITHDPDSSAGLVSATTVHPRADSSRCRGPGAGSSGRRACPRLRIRIPAGLHRTRLRSLRTHRPDAKDLRAPDSASPSSAPSPKPTAAKPAPAIDRTARCPARCRLALVADNP